MFRSSSTATGRSYRVAIVGLLALSLAALVVTTWIMYELLREQEIVAELIEVLPPQGDVAAEELAGELRWQFRLAILVVLNLIVTGFAVVLLSRGYRSSQESLRDFKALAADILGSMDQGVITTDARGVVTSMNRRASELLGLKDESVGRLLDELSDKVSLEGFRQQARSGNLDDERRDFQLGCNGTTKTLRAFCQPLRDREDADIGDVVQLHDVTEQVLVDDRIRRMERYMGLGSLAAGLHHEIKNPLAALSLHVQLLDEELSERDASTEVCELLGVIRTEVARIGGVLESFRDFASIGYLNRSEVDLEELISQQLKLVAPQARKAKIDIQVELPPSGLSTIRVDRVRLEQVLLNLLVNAMEAMPDGGTITIRVSNVVNQASDMVRIEVIDSGPGIPDDLRSRVFDPYFTTKSEGTGMGLALCDKIVRQHDGLLDFSSTENGSVFGITLPVN